MPNLFNSIKKAGLWRGYDRHVVRLNPILERMSERGMPVNKERYAATWKILTDAKAERLAEIQSLVPIEMHPRSPKLGYKRTPKDTTGLMQWPVITSEPNRANDTAEMRWFKVGIWKPSTKALVRYMMAKGHLVPLHIKTKNPTAVERELKRLAHSTRDPLYMAVGKYKKAQTILSNHMVNWRPGDDERVHSTFYPDPATGQLSSRRPNIQNAPSRMDPETGGYVDEFRRMVLARPGHKILEFDYHSFHVMTLAFEAKDPVLMRMGRLDVHSFATAHFLKLPEASQLFDWPNDQLADYLKWVKKTHKHTRNAQVKHAFLGYDNGIGWKKLYAQYQEFFANAGEAKRMLAMFDDLFPLSKRYRDDICLQAHDQHYLISRHGYIRFFYEVFKVKYGHDGTPHYSHGEQHEQALSFFTQVDAHGEIKDRILTLDERGLCERYRFINTIHDSLMFECPDEFVDECISTVKGIMEAPSPVLINEVAPGGLSVQVDVKLGEDWAHAVEQ